MQVQVLLGISELQEDAGACTYKPQEVVNVYFSILLFLRSLKLDRSGASSNLFLKFNLFVYSKALRGLNIFYLFSHDCKHIWCWSL